MGDVPGAIIEYTAALERLEQLAAAPRPAARPHSDTLADWPRAIAVRA
jgi:hypothetical protein